MCQNPGIWGADEVGEGSNSGGTSEFIPLLETFFLFFLALHPFLLPPVVSWAPKKSEGDGDRTQGVYLSYPEHQITTALSVSKTSSLLSMGQRPEEPKLPQSLSGGRRF